MTRWHLLPMRTLVTCAVGIGVGVASPAMSEQHSVRVIDVLDGDTVVVEGYAQRVRLANIDAPEGDHGPHKPGQPYHAAARRWLAEQLLGREVAMRCFEEDRYGRPICEFRRNQISLNVEMVRAGMAWANTASPRYVRDPAVLQAQHEAQQARRGLWAHPAVAPWQWRRECWEDRRCPR